jgi:hypothetical protein
VIHDAHPGPEAGEDHADGLIGIARPLDGKEDESNAERVGDNVDRPNRLVVLLENAKALVNRKREHAIPPSISLVAARFRYGAGTASGVASR